MAQKSLILDKYLTTLERDPKSRVFAPLAEYYRKSGLLTQAIETLNQGIRHNPSYVLGHLGLAFCYFENGDTKRSYDILSPLIDSNRDNLRMLRLFADICLDMNKTEEALETLKYLLFINPKDLDAAKSVKKLESEDKKFGPIKFNLQDVLNETNSKDETESIQFNVEDLNTTLQNEKKIDEWTQVDFSNEPKDNSILDSWSMNTKPDFTEEVEPKEEAERTFKVEQPAVESIKSGSPVITHTLVDLYCNQGYLDKAKDLLEKILELNPNDLKTKLKLQEIVRVIDDSYIDEEEPEESIPAEIAHKVPELENKNLIDADEKTGRNNLMSLFDKKFNDTSITEEVLSTSSPPNNVDKLEDPKLLRAKEVEAVERKLWAFHKALVTKSKSFLSV